MIKKIIPVLALSFLLCFSFFVPFNVSADEGSTEVILFEQDYSAMTAVPGNIFTARFVGDPYYANTHLSYSEIDNAVVHTKYKSEAGELFISGLVPARQPTYNMTVSWTSTYTTSWSGASINIMIGGAYLNCYHGSLPANPFYVRGQYYNSTGSLISITAVNLGTATSMNINVVSYVTNGTAYVTVNGQSFWTPFYRAAYIQDTSNYVYAPDTIQFRSSVATGGGDSDAIIIKLSYLRQTMEREGTVYAIGSTIHQAIGYDGPHSADTVMIGMERIRAAGMTGTIFADIDYIANATYVEYLKGLLDDGWELGIHYSEELDELDYLAAIAVMESEYDTITAAFGTPPLTWCSLGNSENATHAAYAKAALDMVWRNFKVVYQNLPGTHNMVNASHDYWYGVALGNNSTAPMYVHETEVTPAASGSIDKDLWDLYLNATFAGPVRLVGYYEWYMIQANQFDATYTTEITDYGTEITANTNGYTAMTVITEVPTDETIIMDQDGEQIAYSTTPEGYILFEAEDNGVYLVTTLADYRAMQMSEAYFPLYALLPVVITLMVIGAVVEMVVGLKKRF